MTDLFATAADLNTFTGRSIPADQAEMMLGQATAVIRAYCRWHLYPSREETLTCDGSGAAVLFLPTLSVSAVRSVKEDGAEVGSGDYEWSAAGFLRKRCGLWTRSLRGVEALVQHGYEQVPSELAAVCLQLAARAAASPSGVKAEQSGGLSVTYSIPGGFFAGEAAVLDRHRLAAEA